MSALRILSIAGPVMRPGLLLALVFVMREVSQWTRKSPIILLRAAVTTFLMQLSEQGVAMIDLPLEELAE